MPGHFLEFVPLSDGVPLAFVQMVATGGLAAPDCRLFAVLRVACLGLHEHCDGGSQSASKSLLEMHVMRINLPLRHEVRRVAGPAGCEAGS
jgi:hypothetical protein